MNEEHLLFPASCVGKTLMIQKKWDNLKCTDCGCKLKLIFLNLENQTLKAIQITDN